MNKLFKHFYKMVFRAVRLATCSLSFFVVCVTLSFKLNFFKIYALFLGVFKSFYIYLFNFSIFLFSFWNIKNLNQVIRSISIIRRFNYLISFVRGWRFNFRRVKFLSSIKRFLNINKTKKKVIKSLLQYSYVISDAYVSYLKKLSYFNFFKFQSFNNKLNSFINLFRSYFRNVFIINKQNSSPAETVFSPNISSSLINSSNRIYLHLNSNNLIKRFDVIESNPLYTSFYFPYTSHGEDEHQHVFMNMHLNYVDDVLPFGPDLLDLDFYYEMNGEFENTYTDSGWDLAAASGYTIFSYWLKWFGWLGINYQITSNLVLFTILDLHAKCRKAQDDIKEKEIFFVFNDAEFIVKEYNTLNHHDVKPDITSKTTALGKKSFSSLFGHRDMVDNVYWNKYSPTSIRIFNYFFNDWFVWTSVFAVMGFIFLCVFGYYVSYHYFSIHEVGAVTNFYPFKSSSLRTNAYNDYRLHRNYWPFLYKSQPSLFAAPYEWLIFERSFYGRFGIINQHIVDIFVPDFFGRKIWKNRPVHPRFYSEIYEIVSNPIVVFGSFRLYYNSYKNIDPTNVLEESLASSILTNGLTTVLNEFYLVLGLINITYAFYAIIFSLGVLFYILLATYLSSTSSLKSSLYHYLLRSNINSLIYTRLYYVKESVENIINPFVKLSYKLFYNRSQFINLYSWFNFKSLDKEFYDNFYFSEWVHSTSTDWLTFKFNFTSVSSEFTFLNDLNQLSSTNYLNWSSWYEVDSLVDLSENELYLTEEADEELDEMEDAGTDLYWRFEYFSTSPYYSIGSTVLSPYYKRLEWLYFRHVIYPSICKDRDFKFHVALDTYYDVLFNKYLFNSINYVKSTNLISYALSYRELKYKNNSLLKSVIKKNVKSQLHDNYNLVYLKNAVNSYFFFPFDRWIDMEDFIFVHNDQYFIKRVSFSSSLLKLRYYSLWYLINHQAPFNKMMRIFTLKAAVVTDPTSVPDDYLENIDEYYHEAYGEVADFYEDTAKVYLHNTLTYAYMASLPFDRDYELGLVSWYENPNSMKIGFQSQFKLISNFDWYFKKELAVLEDYTDFRDIMRISLNNLYWAENHFTTWVASVQEDSFAANYLNFSESVSLFVYLFNQFEEVRMEFGTNSDDIIIPSFSKFKEVTKIFPSSHYFMYSRQQVKSLGAWPYAIDLLSPYDNYFVKLLTSPEVGSNRSLELDEQNYSPQLISSVIGLSFEQRIHLLIDHKKRTFMRYYDIIDSTFVQNPDPELNDLDLTGFWLSEPMLWFTVPGGFNGYDSWL